MKDSTQFYRDPRNRNGLTSECRACRAAYKRAVRAGTRKAPPVKLTGACDPCRDRRHGVACHGCGCRCRAMLGLDLFEHGDPTVISWDVGNPDDDQTGQVA